MTPTPHQHRTFFMRPTRKEQKAETAILLLYLFFFSLWFIGYALGILESETSILWGLPLWFIISSILSFVVACFGLRLVIKRAFL